jgi:hypothetical protein
MARDIADAIDIGNRGAAEFHHQASDGPSHRLLLAIEARQKTVAACRHSPIHAMA